MAWLAAIPAIIGAVQGAQGQNQSGNTNRTAGPAGSSGLLGAGAVSNNMPSLQNLVNAGPGQESVLNSNVANAQLADMFKRYSQQGGNLPTEADNATGQQFAQQQFAPQQTAQDQQFIQEQQRAKQLAAQMGRPSNDPIIQARLSQERMQSQERLGAQQGAFASQFAMQQPQQRLDYAGQLAQLHSGLASQAMQNRQALIGLGSQLQGQDNSFRAAMGSSSSNQSSGGGLAGALAGGLAGYGAGQGWNLGNGNTNTTQGFADTSKSMFGVQNLNSAYGFNTPQAPQQVNFGSSNAFGQLGGGRQVNNFAAPTNTSYNSPFVNRQY